jgi:hypothetical protein
VFERGVLAWVTVVICVSILVMNVGVRVTRITRLTVRATAVSVWHYNIRN